MTSRSPPFSSGLAVHVTCTTPGETTVATGAEAGSGLPPHVCSCRMPTFGRDAITDTGRVRCAVSDRPFVTVNEMMTPRSESPDRMVDDAYVTGSVAPGMVSIV